MEEKKNEIGILTIEYITKNLKEFEKEAMLAHPKTAGIDRKPLFEQAKREKIMLNDINVCDSQSFEELGKVITNLDPDAVKCIIDNNFFNHNVGKSLSCLVNVMSHNRKETQSNARIREQFKNIRKFGSPSGSGYALKTDIVEGLSPFVVKAPKRSGRVEAIEYIHEAIVGLYATNNLRKFIPNFCYVYGTINCDSPFIDKNGNAPLWCTTNESIQVIYENIDNNISYFEFLKTCTSEEFYMYFLQTMLALQVAHERYKFTHYDLHGNNILIKRFQDKNTYFKYPVDGKDFYIINDGRVSTIIDYGMSYFELGNEKYGNLGDLSREQYFFKYGIFSDRTHPFVDVYKFLMSSIIGTSRNKNGVQEKIIPLLKFFNSTDDLEEIIKKQKPINYGLPDTEYTRSLKIGDWIAFCRQTCVDLGVADPIHDVPDPGIEVTNCDKGCLSVDELMYRIGLKDKEPHPKNFFDIYDLFFYPLSDEELKNIEKHFPEAIEDMEGRLIKIQFDLNQLMMHIYSGNIYTEDYLESVKNYSFRMANFFRAVIDIFNILRILSYIWKVFKNQEDIAHPINELFNQALDIFLSKEKIYKKAIVEVKFNMNYFNPSYKFHANMFDETFVNKNAFRKAFEKNPEYIWYVQDFPKILDGVMLEDFSHYLAQI